ncbi:S41 family peptidase [Virgibacillus xinjiangensis]|uniref:S41 family peptidase n=1 Tax=Virgibacillus xinjiangensis TaxID=393090 RepID=A0ABV7CY45_9BACI
MKRKMPQIILAVIGAVLLAASGVYAGMQISDADNSDTEQKIIDAIESSDSNSPGDTNGKDSMQKVRQAYGIIQQNYLEDVEDQQLVEGAIEGMLSTLEDPHSSYMDVEMMEQFDDQIESSFEGIGAEVSMVNDIVTIVSPIKDSPAEKAGLRPNDQVLSVDGEELQGLNLNEAVAKIRGEKGTEVVLEIQRSSVADPFEVTITRDEIPVETVYSSTETVEGKKTGIIEITNFSENTANEFNDQLKTLESEGIEGLVIDVRANPGGLLNVAEEILSLFVPSDIPYIQIEDQNGETMPYYSDLDEKKDYPISVVIDEGSASASEILAIAMKELGYDVVGKQSYGKGTVQQAVPLGDGSSIKLTTFKWLSPEGKWINEEGVKPTVEVSQPDYFYTSPVQVEESFTYDETDSAISNLQQMLEGLGYEPGRTDGYFDRETEEAVRNFQSDHELEETGEVDEETAGVLEANIMEKIREGEDDRQLEKALQELYQ